MKETSTSLRLYFGIVGILYFIGTGILFLFLGTTALSSAFPNPFYGSPLDILNTIFNIIWALGYLYFAFTLPKYLNPEKVKYVKIFLLIPFVEIVLWSVWGYFALGTLNYIYPIGSALITWYFFANVNRLALPPVKKV